MHSLEVITLFDSIIINESMYESNSTFIKTLEFEINTV